MKPPLLIVTAALIASGCAPAPEAAAPAASAAPDLSGCGGDRYLDHIGVPLDDLRAPLGTTARVFQGVVPNDGDSDPSRLNFAVDDNRTVTRVWCG